MRLGAERAPSLVPWSSHWDSVSLGGGWRSEHPNSHLHSAEAFPLQGVLGCDGGGCPWIFPGRRGPRQDRPPGTCPSAMERVLADHIVPPELREAADLVAEMRRGKQVLQRGSGHAAASSSAGLGRQRLLEEMCGEAVVRLLGRWWANQAEDRVKVPGAMPSRRLRQKPGRSFVLDHKGG